MFYLWQGQWFTCDRVNDLPVTGSTIYLWHGQWFTCNRVNDLPGAGSTYQWQGQWKLHRANPLLCSTACTSALPYCRGTPAQYNFTQYCMYFCPTRCQRPLIQHPLIKTMLVALNSRNRVLETERETERRKTKRKEKKRVRVWKKDGSLTSTQSWGHTDWLID